MVLMYIIGLSGAERTLFTVSSCIFKSNLFLLNGGLLYLFFFTSKVCFVKYKHNYFGFLEVPIFMTYLFLPIPFGPTSRAAVGVSEAGILGSSSGLLLLWSRFVFIFNPFSWSVFQMSKAICLAGLFSIFFVCSFSCGSPPSGFGGLFIHRVGFSYFSLLHVCPLYLKAVLRYVSGLALLARGHPGASPTGLVW